MKNGKKTGLIGWILVIVCGIGGAIGSGLLTLDTSNKVLGGFIEELEEDMKKGDEEEED